MSRAQISQYHGLMATSQASRTDKMKITNLLVFRFGYSDQDVMVSFR